MIAAGRGLNQTPSPGQTLERPARAVPETPAERALERVMRGRHPASVIRLYLSRLDPAGPLPSHHRVARCLFDTAAQLHGGQVFTCGDGDLVLLASPDAAAELASTLLRVFRTQAAPGTQTVAVWSLPEDEAAVRAAFAPGPPTPLPSEPPPAPLGIIAALSALVTAAEPGEFVRRQTAVRIDGRRLIPLFHELYVSLAAMEERLGMAIPASADPYLNRYLSGQLDERLLRSLVGADLSFAPAVQLRLTMTCVDTPAFTAVRALARDAATLLGVEFALPDVIADLRRYAALRDRLQADGCTVTLGGLDLYSMQQIDPAALQPDILKLEWSPRLAALSGREAIRLGAALESFGAWRVVLQRAETEAALLWGRAHGISHFQGRYVDLMLAAERMTGCAHAGGCSLAQCIGRAASASAGGQAGCQDKSRLGRLPGLQPAIEPLATA